MLYEGSMVLVIFILLGVTGIGPALWMLSRHERPLELAVYVAPTVGLALVSLIGFPLVRFVGPIQTWAIAAAVALVIVSIILLVIFRKRIGFGSFQVPWKTVGLESLFFLVCVVVLTRLPWH